MSSSTASPSDRPGALRPSTAIVEARRPNKTPARAQ
jgi:hypothetical protein